MKVSRPTPRCLLKYSGSVGSIGFPTEILGHAKVEIRAIYVNCFFFVYVDVLPGPLMEDRFEVRPKVCNLSFTTSSRSIIKEVQFFLQLDIAHLISQMLPKHGIQVRKHTKFDSVTSTGSTYWYLERSWKI